MKDDFKRTVPIARSHVVPFEPPARDCLCSVFSGFWQRRNYMIAALPVISARREILISELRLLMGAKPQIEAG
jgi:hypothetical protein